jgi:hypothetical protein
MSGSGWPDCRLADTRLTSVRYQSGGSLQPSWSRVTEPRPAGTSVALASAGRRAVPSSNSSNIATYTAFSGVAIAS